MDPISRFTFFGTIVPQSWRLSTPAGITHPYQASFASHVVITTFDGIAIWNALEVFVIVFMTFKSYRGTYFWALLVASFGIIPHSIGNIIHDTGVVKTPAQIQGAVTLCIVGWWLMVSGQLVVLWSRLGLLISGPKSDKLRKALLWMIIIGSVTLYIPTSVLAWCANQNLSPRFVQGYDMYVVGEVVMQSRY